jgi:pyruvate kinase
MSGRRPSRPTCRAKLRVGKFGRQGRAEDGQAFVFDREQGWRRDPRQPSPPRDFRRGPAGTRLLVDDGKLVFRVTKAERGPDRDQVEVGGTISNNKG